MRLFFLCVVSVSLSSCATLFRKGYQPIQVTCSDPQASIAVGDAEMIGKSPFVAKVKRSKHDLMFRVVTEQNTDTFYLKPSLSNEFTLLNLGLAHGAPFGYLIDMTNPRRFDFGEAVYIDLKDTARVLHTKQRTKRMQYFNTEFGHRKGDFDLVMSFPYVNGFNSRPSGQNVRVNTGFWGVGIGLDYYYHPSRYIHLSFAGALDLAYPFPMAVTPADVRESLGSMYVQGSHFFKLKRFELGTGICLARNSWYYTNELNPDEIINDSRRHNSIGFVFSAFHSLGRHFSAGFVYRPTFWQVYPTVGQKYEHVISFELRFRIPMKS